MVAGGFEFLAIEFAAVHAEAQRAWVGAVPDPRTSCFYARRALEVAVKWAFEHDRSLRRPYDSNLSALVNEPSFQAIVRRSKPTRR